MKYKVGDQVKIKSLDWYNKNKNKDGIVDCGNANFIPDMVIYCGYILTIYDVNEDLSYYYMKGSRYAFRDEMIEGLAEAPLYKATVDKNGNMTGEFVRLKEVKQEINLPDGYIFKDENGNIINATKIVLEKKKPEYPKTYEDCCKVFSLGEDGRLYTKGYKASLIQIFQKLLICRDAYWKIAGEEMGLGKPWAPDWNNISDKYCIYFVSGDVWSKECQTRQCPFAFPTPEMRDAFKENFDPDIEICKELL